MPIRTRLLVLTCIMAAVVSLATPISLEYLYRAAIDQQRQRLVEIARGRASMIESVAQWNERHFTDRSGDHVIDPEATSVLTLDLLREAQALFAGFGETGEYTLARCQDNRIVFLLPLRHAQDTAQQSIPWDSKIATPMKLALSGRSGILVGPDYRNVEVLAAYESLPDLGLGVVAKIDFAEVRAPYIRAGTVATISVLALVLMAIFAFWRLGAPIVKALEDNERRYRSLFERSSDAVIVHDFKGNIEEVNERACQLLGYTRKQLLRKPAAELFAAGYKTDCERGTCLGSGAPFESVMSRSDGTDVSVEISSAVVSADPDTAQCLICDVTERRQQRLALMESEEKFRAISSAAQDAIIVMDSVGAIVFWNRAAETTFGYEAHEVLGKPLHGLLAPSRYHSAFREAFQEFRRSGKGGAVGKTLELSAVNKTGSEIPIELSLSAFTLDDQWHATGIVRDITQRKQSEEARIRSESRYQSLYKNMRDGFARFDDSGRITECNHAFAEMLGYNDAEIGELTCSDITPTRWHDLESEIIQHQVLTRGYSDLYQKELIHKDGHVFPVQLRVHTAFDDSGERSGLWAIIRDVSELRKARARLQESEERYRSLVDNIGIGVSLISPQMEILSMNRRMKEWFPHVDPSQRPACYKAYNDPPKDEICSYCPTALTLKDGLVHEAVTETPSKNGLRNYHIIASPIKDKEGIVTAAIESVEDITDSLIQKREMAKADRLESVGVLAGGIAHDFNNILTALIGNLSLAESATEQDSGAMLFLREAQKATQRARGLTLQLLTFSKGGAPVKSISRVGELIRESAAFALRGSDVRCECDIDDEPCIAEIDEGQISQVITNLVINARQAMPNSGLVQIGVHTITLDDTSVVPITPGRYVRITVRDQGSGIPECDLPRIFDPYFTTKANGSGLGLATCHSVVKNHGGRIDVTSQLNIGTAFTIYLPASAALVGPVEEDKQDDSQGSGRILVMDDEESIRRLAAVMLDRLGYEVETAADGEAAVASFRKALADGRPFDAAILDLTLPGGLGGLEIAPLLTEMDPRVITIASSGYSSDPVMADSHTYGFCTALPKPYRLAELRRVITSAMSQSVKEGIEGRQASPCIPSSPQSLVFETCQTE